MERKGGGERSRKKGEAYRTLTAKFKLMNHMNAFAYGDFSHYTFTRRVIIRVSLSSVQGSSRVKKRDGEEGSTNFSTV